MTVEHPFESNLLLVLAIGAFGAKNDGHAAASQLINDPIAADQIASLGQVLIFAMAQQRCRDLALQRTAGLEILRLDRHRVPRDRSRRSLPKADCCGVFQLNSLAMAKIGFVFRDVRQAGN